MTDSTLTSLDPVATARENARLRLFLVIAAGALVVLALAPADLKGPAYVLYAAFALTWATHRCWRLPPPIRRITLTITAAGILSVAGGVVRTAHSMLTGEQYPYPSVADVLPLLAYFLFLAAILAIVRRRNPHLTLDPLLDALVGGVAAAVWQWTLVIIPFLSDPDTTTAERAVTVVYGLVALLLIVAAVLALVAGSRPTASNRLLAAGLVMTFAMDVGADLVAAGRISEDVLLFTGAAIMILGGAGLLHPSVHHLLERPSDASAIRRLSQRRIVVLAFALVGPPLLLLWELAQGNRGAELLLPALGAIALAPVVLMRLGRLVHQNESLASLEATLRSVGERLVAAESKDEVAGVITAGLEQVVGRGFVAGGLVVDPHRPDSRARAHELAPAIDSLLADEPTGRPALTGDLRRLDFDPHQVWHVGPVVVQRMVRACLVVVTNREVAHDERNAVVTLCREAAIALRAVERTELNVRQRSEARFAALVNNSSDIVAILDDGFDVVYVSPVAERVLGYEPSRANLMEIVHPDDRAAASDMLADVRFGGGEPTELRLRHLSGDYFWFDVVAVDLQSDPNIGGVVLNARAIGDRKAAEERLLLSEARFRALVQHSSDLVLVVDSHDRTRYASPSARRIIGEQPEELMGRPLGGVFRGSDLDWDSALRSGQGDETQRPVPLEFGFRNVFGEWVQVEAMVSDLRGEPAVGGFVLNARDVTERKRMIQHLRYQATHDGLTNLANRVLAGEELDGMLSRNAGSSTVAVVSVDIDDFKDINDSFGHGFGDRVLVAVADRIRESLAFGDVAARSGGDEFVVVLERAHGEDQVLELAFDLLRSMERPFSVDDRELSITASAGIAYDHDRDDGAESLLRNADTAMYQAKLLGKRQIVVFEPHMRTASFDRLELRADLAGAIGTEQLVVHYQPILDLVTGRISGTEALVRWDHPRRGRLSPAVFVPIAEELGMIGRLGAWVLQRACSDLARWRAEAPEVAGALTLAVNLSAQELHAPDLVASVTGALRRSGLPADRLVLEVTESNLLSDTEDIRERIQQLRSLGTRLAIDDFGTGYSSLGYIQRYAFDILKIDRSFVEGLDQGTNVQIITAVLELAGQLGVDVVAEGIEEEAQERVLKQLGCRFGQGFLYSRPITAAGFRQLLGDWQRVDTQR